MQEAGEHLEAAACNILLVGLTWPPLDGSAAGTSVDLHVESARQWVTVVVERLLNWSDRAHKIAAALERSGFSAPNVHTARKNSPGRSTRPK